MTGRPRRNWPPLTPGARDEPFSYLTPAHYTADDHDYLTVERLQTGVGFGVWTSYSVSVVGATTAPGLGSTGSVIGYYTRLGNTVICKAEAYFDGTGISNGSGLWGFTLPVASRDIAGLLGYQRVPSHGYVYDQNTAVIYLARGVIYPTENRVYLFGTQTDSTIGFEVGITHTFITLAAGDAWQLGWIYEAA